MFISGVGGTGKSFLIETITVYWETLTSLKFGEVVNILDQVQYDSTTQESQECLKKWMINGTVVDKYIKLCKSGSSPVCLFLCRELVRIFNQQMFTALDTELHKIACIYEIDETSSHK